MTLPPEIVALRGIATRFREAAALEARGVDARLVKPSADEIVEALDLVPVASRARVLAQLEAGLAAKRGGPPAA